MRDGPSDGEAPAEGRNATAIEFLLVTMARQLAQVWWLTSSR